ncbi:MAG: hypothetical protein ACM3XZ_03540 [Betaproteobacteria bacterium]
MARRVRVLLGMALLVAILLVAGCWPRQNNEAAQVGAVVDGFINAFTAHETSKLHRYLASAVTWTVTYGSGITEVTVTKQLTPTMVEELCDDFWSWVGDQHVSRISIHFDPVVSIRGSMADAIAPFKLGLEGAAGTGTAECPAVKVTLHRLNSAWLITEVDAGRYIGTGIAEPRALAAHAVTQALTRPSARRK